MSCDGQVFTLVDDAGRRVRFDPRPWLDGAAAQLVWLSEDGAEYLLHVPKLQSSANYMFFYYLDTGVFRSHIESLLSEEVPAVALLDSFGNPVASSGFEGYGAAVKELPLTSGVQPLSEDHLLHITPLRQMLESNYCDPNFSVAEIAEAYHVSPSRMSTLFKNEMGIGFLEYVWKMRLEKAQELLRTTDLSVDEISLQVGYLASTSFSRKFKQETGMTPSQYRSKFAASGSADQD